MMHSHTGASASQQDPAPPNIEGAALGPWTASGETDRGPAAGPKALDAIGANFIHHYAIRSLGETFADAANRHDYDRFADLWTEDGVWEIGAPIDVRFAGRPAIRDGIEQMLGRWDFFVQMPHAFDVEINGPCATAYWTVHEVARTRDGGQGNSNISLYLDDVVLTPEGWRFRRRRYRTIYADTTPLTGQRFHLAPAELRRLSRSAVPV